VEGPADKGLSLNHVFCWDCRDHSEWAFLWNWILFPPTYILKNKKKNDAMEVFTTFIFVAKISWVPNFYFPHEK